MKKSVLLLIFALGFSVAYFVYAVRKLGMWAGVVFAIIWASVFLYQRSRSRRPE